MSLTCLAWAAAALVPAAAALHPRGAAHLHRRYRAGRLLQAAIVAAFGAVATASLLASHHHDRDLAMSCPAALLVVSLATATVLGRSAIPAVATARPRVVLAVAAHPDDLELACGGTLARFVDAGHTVHALVMTSGAQGGASERRRGEAERGAAFLGFASARLLDYPDTQLPLCEGALMQEIEDAITAYRPDVILTHSAHDQHQDHVAVHRASLRAARAHHSILCYESPSATRDFNPSVYFDIDHYVGVKAHAVALHEDQAHKRYMGRRVLEGTAAFRGHQVKRRHAEGFEVVRLLADQAGVF